VESWHDYMVAQAGAAAALAGLVFVGLSINLDRILKIPSVVNRAAAALFMLLGVLLISSLVLVPGDSHQFRGVLVLVVGGAIWGFVTWLSVGILRGTETRYHGHALRLFVMRQVALLPALIGGGILLTGNEDGLYWIVGCFTITFVVTLVEAWVILVEIDR
jgi:hypothetical protein